MISLLPFTPTPTVTLSKSLKLSVPLFAKQRDLRRVMSSVKEKEIKC